MKRKTGNIFTSGYGWLWLLVIIAVVNYLASMFHARFDLTKEKRYTLSSTTKQLLSALDDDMEVEVFLKGEFPSGFRRLAGSTDEFLQLLQDRNGSRFHYRFISPQDDIPGEVRKTYGDSLVNMGVNPINLTVRVSAGQEQKYIYPVAIIKYKGQARIVNLFAGASREISQIELNNAEALLEYQFLKALDELVTNRKPVVAYATGNGEPIDYRVFDLTQTIKEKYAFFTFNLSQQKVIPDEFNVLLIAKPAEPFSDAEKLKIDQYIMRGGQVIFFLDRLYAESDSLQYKPELIAYDRNLGLTDILFRYGARVNPDLLMDLRCDFMPLIVGGSPDNPQQEYLPWNYYPYFEANSTHLINKGMGPVVGRFVNSVDTIQTEGVKKTILLSSSPNARTISTPALISLNENKFTPVDAKFNRKDIPVAVLLEGKFTSFFRNRIGKAEMDSLANAGTPFRDQSMPSAKVIVVGDGDIVLNELDLDQAPIPMGWNKYTYEEYRNQKAEAKYFIPFSNKGFVQNCLEYFTNKPGIIETGSKEIVLRLLNGTKVKKQKIKWQLINIALPVLLVILFGLIYQQTRKNKYAS